MSVADTSLDAYREHRDSGELGAQQKKVMMFFHLKGGEYTRSELAQSIPMRLSSVCGRVNELIKLGYLVECQRRPCKVTGINAHPIKLPPRQLELAA
jgi:predicted transcriptional regulator